MIFSRLLAPDTPEWLSTTSVVVYIISIFGFLGWGMILELRYISPYTLINTSDREKWRRAANLAFFQSAMIPILGLVAPIISPLPDQWPFIPICFGIWVILLPIVTVFKRWGFERHIKRNYRFDKMIKDNNNIYQRLFSSPLISCIKIFLTADHKRFLSEGFPDDINQDTDFVS
ncbi:MAG: hypothetical protein ABFS17_14410 [Chloroflexota bacterium]